MTGQSEITRNQKRHELVLQFTDKLPGYIRGRDGSNYAAVSGDKTIQPRKERRQLARAYAAGVWRKSVADRSL